MPSCAQKLCLNMIVKNEEAIIRRCLISVAPFLDSWAICDTGSTDNTREIISTFFAERGIPGHLTEAPFVDFSQARNAALDAFELSDADYALLLDADMELVGSIDRSSLSANAYHIMQRDSARSYWNTRIVKRGLGARYVGVTHEFLSVPGPAPSQLSTCSFIDYAAGSSRVSKSDRDANLLLDGLTKDPTNARYMFYLARTFRESARQTEAIPWYLKRIEAGGWDEEVWAARRELALCHRDMGSHAEFIQAALAAYNFRPERAEPLHDLARYYRLRGENEAAAAMCDLGARIGIPRDILFVEDAIYNYGFAEEMAIVGFYCRSSERKQAGYEACAQLTTHPNAVVRDTARWNFTFYSRSAERIFGARLLDIAPIHPDAGYVPMNPSIYCGPGRWAIIRTVNYTVTKDGAYPTSDNSGIIRTRNRMVRFDAAWSVVEDCPIIDATDTPRTNFPVEGFEDCRLFRWRDNWWCSTTVRDRSDGRCEIALIRLVEGESDGEKVWNAVDLRIVRDMEPEKYQKNWMPFASVALDVGSKKETSSLRFLYTSEPTTVIDLAAIATGEGPTKIITRLAQQGRNFSGLRGGSQLIPAKGGGWIGLVHDVSHVPHRVYLHSFILLDENMRISALSDPFHFEHRGIEFAAGLARDGTSLVASYGVDDARARLAIFDESAVMGHLLSC